MATELAAMYVSILPETSRIAPGVRRELGQVESDANATGRRAGSGLGSALSGGLRVVGAGITAVTTLVGGLALGGGISRALAIENAQAKLRGLGHDAASVTQIMNDALASVKGTAFGLGDAATVAAGLVAAGISQGPQLEGILKSVADTATISGRSLTDIGTIFGSVAARGKLQGDDMLQLMSSGVPVLQFLSKQLGVSSADISKMVSKGQIDFATFAAAMQAGMGGAALASGTTFTGSLANVRAALSRLGAQVASPVLASLKGVFNNAIPAIDSLGAKLAPLITSLAERLAPIVAKLSESFFTWLANVDFSSLLSGLSSLGPLLGPLIGLLTSSGSSFANMLGPLGAVLPDISGPLGIVGGLLTQMLAQSPELRAALGQTLGIVGGIVQSLAPSLQLIVAQLADLAASVAGGLASALIAINPFLTSLGQYKDVLLPLIVAVGAFAAAWQVYGAVTRVVAVAQGILNAVMDANPIALIIIAVAALVAGLIYFFTQTKLGRQIVTTVFTAIREAVGVVVDWWQNTAEPALVGVWAKIQAAAAPLVAWFGTYVVPLIQAYVGLVVAYFHLIGMVVSWLWTNVFKPTIDFIVAYWQFLWTTIQAIWSVIGPPLIANITGIFHVLAAVLGGVWDVMRITFEYVWNAMRIVVETVLKVITGIIRTATAIIKGDWSGAWNALKDTFGAIWDGIKALVQNALGTVGDLFGSLKGTILNVFAAADTWLVDVGRKIIDGLLHGITSAFDKVKGALGHLTDMLPDWKGPAAVDAKLLTGNGRLIMQSLVAGFQDEAPAVQRYLAGFTASLGDAGTVNTNLPKANADGTAGGGGITINATADPLLARHYAEEVARATELAWRDENATAGVR